jgi:hypothetical protein
MQVGNNMVIPMEALDTSILKVENEWGDDKERRKKIVFWCVFDKL